MTPAVKYSRILAKCLFVLFMLESGRNWVQWTFFPDTQMNFFQVSAETLWGINMLKTDMTSGVAASGLFVLLYFLRGKQWLPPAIALVSVFLVTRAISLVMDGVSAMLWAGVAYELVYLAIAVFLFRTEPQGAI